MNEIVKKDIINILEEIVEILRVKEEKDYFELKGLSNHTIHDASIFQDENSLSIAVLVYSLSKIIERGGEPKNLLSKIQSALNFLRQGAIEDYKYVIKDIFKTVSQADTKLKLYTEEVIHQARIKKASKLYEHGISVGRTSDLLGISQWELINYLGKTTIPDEPYKKGLFNKRIIFAKRLFGVK